MDSKRFLGVTLATGALAFISSIGFGGEPETGASSMTKPVAGHVHHTIDYIELTVTDMAAAKRFYAAAFGWSFNDYGPDYAGIQGQSPDREVGGFRLDAKVVRGGPLVVLFSEDLEKSVAAVEQAGGKISTALFEFPGGRRFHFTDPSGNELAVWGR